MQTTQTRQPLSALVPPPPPLKPEAVEFIKAANPKPKTELEPPGALSPSEKPTGKEPAPKLKGKKKAEIASLISIHVRVPLQIAQGLLKASSDRKLERITPFTQQAIIHEAFTDWLQRNGYWPEE